jgi:iron complex outermembrane receptor protein
MLMKKTMPMSGTAMLLAMASPALAQHAAGNQSQPASTATDDGGALGDIIVTAQKRSESIQSVPVAVSALSAEQLENPSISDIRDLAGRVPSLVVDSVAAGPSAAAISIRGVSFEDIEKSFDPTVGIVVDGVFIGTNTGQLLDSFDLASLEVLRGPQGTLFGRNTIGGVINATRTKPTGAFGVKASVNYSSFNTKTGRLVVNAPTIGGVLALKGFLYYGKTDGYYYNATLGRPAGKYETLSGGVTAKITPADNVEALITYEHMRERGETVVTPLSNGTDLICILPLGLPAAECNRNAEPYRGVYTTYQNIETPVLNDTDAVTGQLTIGLGGGFDLVSITGWRRNKEDVTQDFDGSSITFFNTRRRQTYEQFSQEVRVVGDLTPWLNALVGGYYFDSNYVLGQATQSPLFGANTLYLNTKNKSRSYAGFVDLKIKPTDKLTIGLGGRYTNDHKELVSNFGVFVDGAPCPAPAVQCQGAKTFNKFTWRASADYRLATHALIYASASSGFRSGGFNGRASSPTTLGPYDPETVTAYEVGLKADWLDRRLRTNLAAFRTNYTNKQEEVVQATAPPFNTSPQETVVRNASSARITGFEAEIVAVPDDHLTVNLALSYLDAKYIGFLRDLNGDNIPDDVSTLTLRRAPKWSWSAGADYKRDVGQGILQFSTQFRFIDKYATSIVPNVPIIIGQVINDTRSIAEPREILDASLAYTLRMSNAEVRFTVYGRNLTDNRGLASALPVARLFTFGSARPPRSFGGEVMFKF